jgi:hypothetical protein
VIYSNSGWNNLNLPIFAVLLVIVGALIIYRAFVGKSYSEEDF